MTPLQPLLPRPSLLSARMFAKLPRGSTLVMVLFIMLVAMVITTTVTTVILNNLQSTILSNQQTHAFYAMESGVERALQYIQFARASKTVGAEASATTTSAFTDILSNDGSYAVSTTVESSDSVDLVEGGSVQWDFYAENYSSGYRLVPMTDLDHIIITWSESSGCSSGGSQIEVSFSSWTESNWEDISDPTSVQTHFTDMCGADCTYELGVDSTHLYKVRAKALNCDITNVQAIPYDTTNAALAVANTMNVTSLGTYGQANREGGAVAPWNPALTQYYEYVLFSEAPVIK